MVWVGGGLAGVEGVVVTPVLFEVRSLVGVVVQFHVEVVGCALGLAGVNGCAAGGDGAIGLAPPGRVQFEGGALGRSRGVGSQRQKCGGSRGHPAEADGGDARRLSLAAQCLTDDMVRDVESLTALFDDDGVL